MLKPIIYIWFIILFVPYSLCFAQGIEISAGASVESIGATSIEIEDGDFKNDGSFIMGTGDFVFSGTSAATILGTNDIDFYQLSLNNLNGLTLNNDGFLAVNQLLNLTSGIIQTNNKVLIIRDDASITGYNSSRFIDGFCRKIGDDAFLFPVGKNGQYAPLSISAPSNTDDHYTVSYYDEDPNTSYSVASLTGGLNNVSTNEYWICERTNGSSDVCIQLHWENAALSGISDYTSDLVVATWNDTVWENCGNTAITASSTGNVTSISTNTFGPFTFGSLSPSINVLPIGLLNFSLSLKNGIVNVDWETSTEINNDYFEIERSQDGLAYEVIGSVSGAGNSSTTQSYAFFDVNPLGGTSFYRLKQVDYDGASITFSPQKISFSESIIKLLAFPNPVEDEVNISYNLANGIYANSIGVYDMYGHLVLSQDISKVEDVLNVDISQLDPGSYIIALKLGSEFINSVQLLVK